MAFTGDAFSVNGDSRQLTTVSERVKRILHDLPSNITVVAAAKGARPEDLIEALEAGIRVVGQNHVSEARAMRGEVFLPAEWHFIGRLRPHAVRASTLRLFDAVQSVDSLELAERIDAVCAGMNKYMPVFVEVNSGREPQKGGVLPEQVEVLARGIARLQYIRVTGLMTMGPAAATPDGYRPCFAETRQLFEHMRALGIPGCTMEHLSMGMSDSFEVAIQEGATMVRLGTVLFGRR